MKISWKKIIMKNLLVKNKTQIFKIIKPRGDKDGLEPQ